MEKINIWRFNLHTNHSVEEQMKTFEYCELNNIIGTGWRTNIRLMDSEKEKISNEEFYDRLNQIKFTNQTGFRNSMKFLNDMKKDDLIWTRKNNTYYICRVTGRAKDFMVGDRSKEIEDGIYDIWHYVPCEFVKVGTEDNVLGAIVRSFNMGVVCHIRGNGSEDIVREFSKRIYNRYTGKNYYKEKNIDDKWNYLWETMGAMEIEEIVGLYMQIKLGYGIYTSTNKKDTKEYEYILFKRENPEEKAKIQVKTSNINIDSYNLGDMPFYFFTTGNYWKDGKVLEGNQLKIFSRENKVEILSKEEILDFVKENEKFLPYKLKWF